MKTLCVTASWLNGADNDGSPYWARLDKYFYYYVPLMADIGIDRFLVLNNGTNPGYIPKRAHWEFIDIVALEPEYRRGKNHDYPYVWRHGFEIQKYFNKYEKILTIEDDSFILTKRLADWVRERRAGYTALWCPLHNMPECNLQVICEDSYDIYRKHCTGDFMKMNGRQFEVNMPHTHIEKGFNCDRYSEYKPPQPPTFGIDFYPQCPLGVPVKYCEDIVDET